MTVSLSNPLTGVAKIQVDGVDKLVINADDSVDFAGAVSTTDLSYTGTLTGGTGIINIGSGQIYKGAGGNVGIGTSTPRNSLDVTGGLILGLAQNLTWGDVFGAGVPTIAGTSSGLDFYPSGSTSDLSLRLDSAGNAGLGVVPSAWGVKALDFEYGGVSISNALGAQVSSNAFYNGTNWIYKLNSSATRYQQDSNGHAWLTAPSGTAGSPITFNQAMLLDADASLFLNNVSNTTIGYNLNINGVPRAGFRYNDAGGFGSIGTFISQDFLFLINNTERARITSGGYTLRSNDGTYIGSSIDHQDVQASTTASDRVRGTWHKATVGDNIFDVFHTDGGATARGSISFNRGAGVVAYNTTSDYRLKNNPQPLTGSGGRIDALKPSTWSWAANDSIGTGFIAHEFAAVYPNSVTGEKDAVDEDGNPKYQAMSPSTPEVIADLVAEIQSLRKRIQALEAK